MANAVQITLALAASSANNICLSQTPSGTTPLAINGAAAGGGVATLDTQRRVLVTNGAETNKTLTIAGTNLAGAPIAETVLCPNGGGTVATLQDFVTVTQIAPNGSFANPVTVGTNTVGSTRWIGLDRQVTPIEIGQFVTVTGAVTYTVEWTPDNIQTPASYIPDAFADPVMALQTTSKMGVQQQPAQAIRLTVTAGTGTVRFSVIQAGLSQGDG
jgi:hypothetical protein